MDIERVRQYEHDSLIDPRVEIRPSKIHGLGIFAKEAIAKGETIIIWGGILFKEEDLNLENIWPNSLVDVGEGVFLVVPIDSAPGLEDYMNHSCDPNLWMADEVTLTARRNIDKDEELTLDYAMFFSHSKIAELYEFKCSCGSPACRGFVTRNDWKIREVQRKYKNHFSPYLNRLIEKASLG